MRMLWRESIRIASENWQHFWSFQKLNKRSPNLLQSYVMMYDIGMVIAIELDFVTTIYSTAI
jgi:hypothetical protein